MCLNEIYSRARVDKYSCDTIPIENDLKQGDALPPLLFYFVLEYAMGTVQAKQFGLKRNVTHQLPFTLMILIYRVKAQIL